MRRWLIILLSIQIISSGNAFGEMVKLINLLDHYSMHIRRGEVSDLSEFIMMHYFDPEHQRSDPGRHAHLPLHHLSAHSIVVYHVSASTISMNLLPELPSKSYMIIETDHYSLTGLFDIFQPPRFDS